MPITLTPEQEAAIRKDAEQIGFDSVEDYLSDRLSSLHAQEQFFIENHEELGRMIDEGIESAERGELFTLEEVKAELATAKLEFRAAKSSAA